MSAMVVWAVLAGFALVIEMLTGTVYLLGASVGAGAALAATAFGASVWAQILVFSLFTCASFFIVVRSKKPASKTPDADVGEVVEVVGQASHGVYRVSYRGTEWDAFLEGPAPVETPTHLTITRIVGTRLQCKAK